MQQITRLCGAPASNWTSAAAAERSAQYELRYQPLSGTGCGFAFPCDGRGQVPMDELSERALANYLYARSVVGYELQWPLVRRLA
jgi:hypothetical protein